jgi:ribonuclease HI
VETLAAWQAVDLGVQMGATYLELEGDAMEVVQGLNQANHCWGRDGPVLNDIKTLFQNFNAWQVKYVPREANGAAHRLARLALTNGLEYTWHDNFSLSVLNVVCAEQVHDLN